MKAIFKVNDKVTFKTMPIPMTVVAVNRIPKTKSHTSYIAYWCKSQYGDMTQVDEQDIEGSNEQ